MRRKEDFFKGNIVDLQDVTIDENGGNHKLNKKAKSYGTRPRAR